MRDNTEEFLKLKVTSVKLRSKKAQILSSYRSKIAYLEDELKPHPQARL